MDATIYTAEQSWIANLEHRQRAGTASGMTRFFPYFVETAGIAAVPPDKIDRPDPEPPGNPDVDRVLLGQFPAGPRALP